MAIVKKIEDILDSVGVYNSKTVGDSMKPLLVEGVTVVEIKKVNERLKKFDIALFKRDDKYILHRVVKVKSDHYLIVGDNRFRREHVKDSQILGVVTRYYKNNKWNELDTKEYHKYVKSLKYRRIKVFFKSLLRKVKRLLKKL